MNFPNVIIIEITAHILWTLSQVLPFTILGGKRNVSSFIHIYHICTLGEDGKRKLKVTYIKYSVTKNNTKTLFIFKLCCAIIKQWNVRVFSQPISIFAYWLPYRFANVSDVQYKTNENIFPFHLYLI